MSEVCGGDGSIDSLQIGHHLLSATDDDVIKSPINGLARLNLQLRGGSEPNNSESPTYSFLEDEITMDKFQRVYSDDILQKSGNRGNPKIG